MSVPLGDPYPKTLNPYAMTLLNSGSLNVFSLSTGALLATGISLSFDFASATIDVDGTLFALENLWIAPASDVTTTLGWDLVANNEHKVELRGGFVIKPTPYAAGMLWSAINVVSLNDYLKSVVPSEVISSWHSETLRAQAIAARTYGLYEVATSRAANQDYDVDPTTWYQSYQGRLMWNRSARAWRNIELSATTNAVAATGNQVITYDGELIKSYFSSNSGGRTCTAAECFESGVQIPYLQEVDDASGVRNSPGGTWGTRATLSPANIKAKLREHGFEFNGTVKRLESLERGPSGRTWRLRLVLTNGSTVSLTRANTRKVMHLFGPIRSFQYALGAVGGGKQRITGYGYGHGVGLSQWGAQLFAKRGWSAERILEHYYTGVSITNL